MFFETELLWSAFLFNLKSIERKTDHHEKYNKDFLPLVIQLNRGCQTKQIHTTFKYHSHHSFVIHQNLMHRWIIFQEMFVSVVSTSITQKHLSMTIELNGERGIYCVCFVWNQSSFNKCFLYFISVVKTWIMTTGGKRKRTLKRSLLLFIMTLKDKNDRKFLLHPTFQGKLNLMLLNAYDIQFVCLRLRVWRRSCNACVALIFLLSINNWWQREKRVIELRSVHPLLLLLCSVSHLKDSSFRESKKSQSNNSNLLLRKTLMETIMLASKSLQSSCRWCRRKWRKESECKSSFRLKD